ncbi:response regulator [Cohnella boryungensis]|uniref:Response regulator n=1 Tax=Cohnella boryungensis TaxID=768479 RepID=A0ABV8S9C9_9BACL
MKMWNLLVVEDESIVRVGLRYLVEWESYGVVWKAEASNGEEALRILDSQDIHIVMTDIRMPVMDGIQLAKRIKESYSHIQVVVISSYDDFPYVQEALRLGVSDYLHKPTMAREEIVAMLETVLKKLRSNSAVPAEAATPTEKERNAYVGTLLDGTAEAGKREEEGRRLGLPEIGRGLRLVGIRLSPKGQEQDDAQHADNSRFVAARYFIEDYISHDWGGVVAAVEPNELIWLAPEKPKNATREWAEYQVELKRNLANLLNVALLFSVSAVLSEADSLPEAYREVRSGFLEQDGSIGQAVRMVKDYVDIHFREELSLTHCAELVHISTAHLSRIFLKETGMNFSEYVIRKKMDYAKELLRDTNLRIYEVSAKAGYTHPHYFSKLFKEYAGVSPIEYRNGL